MYRKAAKHGVRISCDHVNVFISIFSGASRQCGPPLFERVRLSEFFAEPMRSVTHPSSLETESDDPPRNGFLFQISPFPGVKHTATVLYDCFFFQYMYFDAVTTVDSTVMGAPMKNNRETPLYIVYNFPLPPKTSPSCATVATTNRPSTLASATRRSVHTRFFTLANTRQTSRLSGVCMYEIRRSINLSIILIIRVSFF